MTICNMSIEGGARIGYVNPDETTFEYLRGRRFAPQGDGVRSRASPGGDTLASDPGASWDDVVRIDAAGDRADGDLGHQPRAVGAPWTPRLPEPAAAATAERRGA